MRLIDGGRLAKEIMPQYKELLGTDIGHGMGMVLDEICAAPTIEAVELPPIKIGDTAYFIIRGKIYKAEVYFIRWEQHRQYGIHSKIAANVTPYSTVGASFNDFGKTVFLTKEEAEAALAEMDGGANHA